MPLSLITTHSDNNQKLTQYINHMIAVYEYQRLDSDELTDLFNNLTAFDLFDITNTNNSFNYISSQTNEILVSGASAMTQFIVCDITRRNVQQSKSDSPKTDEYTVVRYIFLKSQLQEILPCLNKLNYLNYNLLDLTTLNYDIQATSDGKYSHLDAIQIQLANCQFNPYLKSPTVYTLFKSVNNSTIIQEILDHDITDSEFTDMPLLQQKLRQKFPLYNMSIYQAFIKHLKFAAQNVNNQFVVHNTNLN